MRIRKEKTIPLQIRFHEDEIKSIEEITKLYGCTKAELLRLAVKLFLKLVKECKDGDLVGAIFKEEPDAITIKMPLSLFRAFKTRATDK